MNRLFKVNLLVKINNSSENEKSLDADFKGNFWQKTHFFERKVRVPVQ